MNYLIMLRPSKEELDALEQEFGNEGWNWESLLHYMKKVRVREPPPTVSNTPHRVKPFNRPDSPRPKHANTPSNLTQTCTEKTVRRPDPHAHCATDHRAGPLKVSFPCVLNDMHRRFFDAAERLGVPRNPEAVRPSPRPITDTHTRGSRTG